MPDITIDTTALDHDVVARVPGDPGLHRPPGVHELTVPPGTGYGFISASGINAEIAFDVTSDGTVVLVAPSTGYASTTGPRLTVSGRTIALDTRALSQRVWPQLLGFTGLLPPDLHELTVLPAAGYGFIVGSGNNASLKLTVDTSGTVVLDPQFAGVAQATGNTLVVDGCAVTIDPTGLSYDLHLSLLNEILTLTRDRAHQLRLLPAQFYLLKGATAPFTDLTFTLDNSGAMHPF